jgi:hypothetical protein
VTVGNGPDEALMPGSRVTGRRSTPGSAETVTCAPLVASKSGGVLAVPPALETATAAAEIAATPNKNEQRRDLACIVPEIMRSSSLR